MTIWNNLPAFAITTASLLTTTSPGVLAQGEGHDFLDLSLDDLADVDISVATATHKPVRLAPAVTTVITAKDIKAMGWRTLDEALESVPGFHVGLSAFNRLNSLISIRGIHTGQNAQVMVMIDGLPFNTPTSGYRASRFTLPVENISRIEIIRGPGSAIYGADAYAGVINVITKDASEVAGLAAGIRAGTFDTRDGWAQAGGEIADWDVAFSFEYSHSDGDSERIVDADQQTRLDRRFETDASLAPGPLETAYTVYNASMSARRDYWTVSLSSWNLRDGGMGAGGAQALDPAGNQEVDHYSVVVDYSNKNLRPHWELDSKLSYRSMDDRGSFRLLPPGTTVPVGADGNLFTPNTLCAPRPVCLVNFPDGVWGNPGGVTEEYRLEVATAYRGFANHRIRFAVGFDRDSLNSRESKNFGPGVIDGTVSPIDGSLTDVTGTNYVFLPDTSRTDRYLSLQDEWRFSPDWELTAGVRYDTYSDFGDTANPRAALVWNTTTRLTTKALYGRAFRAPNLGELNFQNNPNALGNENLKPETIDIWELAVDYRPNLAWQAVAGVFRYAAKDLIDYVDHRAANSGKQTGNGLEAEATWQPSNIWRIKGNVALQYAENKDTDEAVANAPRRQAYLAALWQHAPRWSTAAEAKWIADRPRARAAADTRPAIDDYTLVNVAVHFTPATNWQLAAVVRNVFDENAKEPSDIANGAVAIPDDYPLAGRSVFVEARFRAP
jgi:iron complex outermembrane receptor protein